LRAVFLPLPADFFAVAFFADVSFAGLFLADVRFAGFAGCAGVARFAFPAARLGADGCDDFAGFATFFAPGFAPFFAARAGCADFASFAFLAA
jgi:hypothetical protein